MKRIALIVVLWLMAGVSLAQSTYLTPVPGHRHIYTAIFQKGNYPTRWYVATNPDGTRAPYNTAYTFDEFTEGVAYNPAIDALTGRDLMAVSIRWGETLNEGEEYYVFVEVENKGCTNRMAMKVIIAKDNTPQNLPPVAITDYAATNFGELVCINLLRNDFDLDNDTIFLANVYQPGSGALISYAGTDSICYTPPTGYVGTDTLIYRICDSGTPSLCDADTLFVTVLDPIVARPDYAELYAGDQTSLALLPNDTFQAPVVPSVIEDPKHGRYTLSPDGVLTYLADPDYMGNDTLIYLIRNAGGADTALVVLQIKPLVSLTASPFCNNGEPWFWWETTARGFVPKSVGLKLYDLNGNLVHEMAAAPLSGSMAWPGEFSKSSPLPPAELTTISIDIRFSEVPETGVLSSSINYPNCTQNIVVAVADTATIYGVPTVLNILANDYDPDEGEIDTLSVALHRDSISQGPYHGHLTFNSDGTLTYTPDLEYNGLDSFVYRICDDFSPTACDTAIVKLTLWYNAPIVANTDHLTIYTGQTALIDILSNDTDPEGKIDLASIDLLDDPKNGNALINPDGTITYKPLTGFTGTDSLLYTVCDLGTPRTCDSAWVYINVKQNETIMANRDNIETIAGSPVTFDPIINDFDPEGKIDTTSLQILTINNPKNGTASVNNGTITYIPDQGYSGLDSFVYRLCDAGSPVTCDTAMVYINIIDNNLGIVANPDLAYAIDWEPVTVKILSNDFDPDTISSIDPSTVILTSQPLNGTVLLNPDGSLTYTPNPGFLGNDTLIYQVCDNAPIVACDTALVVLISSSVLPPVAANDTLNLMHGAPFSFDIIGNDYDPAGRLDSTSLTIVNPPANGELAFDISTGVYTYQPDQCNFSLDSFTYHVSNTSGLTSNIAVVYLNTSINPKLDLDGDSILDLDEDLANTGNLCDTDTDKDGTPDFLDPDDDDDFIPTIEERGDLDDNGVPDYLENWNSKAVDDNILTGVDIPVWIPVMNNDSLTMLSTTLHPTENPKHGYVVVNQANGGFNYYPEFDYMGNDSFRYVVCDHYDICDTALVTIAVEDILVAPELFTPNDDGNNDRYVISGIENYPKNLFLVYNRWGNKVYEKENYANEWDGTSNANMRLGNQVLPVGVYYYILRYSDRREKQGGLYLER